MRITVFERVDEEHSIGAAAGEGLEFRFLVSNFGGTIDFLEQFIEGNWFIEPSPAPMFLRTLVAAKMADERWRHGSN